MSGLRIRTENITKDYPGTRALDDVTFLLTAVGCMHWSARMDPGNPPSSKYSQGQSNPLMASFTSMTRNSISIPPSDAYEKGIITVYQEMSLVPGLSVAENIF